MCTSTASTAASSAPSAAPTPFPYKTVGLLLLVTLADGIVITFLMPMVPFMVRSYGVSEAAVGSSAGLLASVFNLAGLFSGFFWGRMSDVHGRRPVLCFGLLSTAVTVLWFGLARSLGSAVAARVAGGLLNANQAITRAMLREACPEEHRTRAFSSIGQAWGIGFFVGPLLGGVLSRPADSVPALRGGPFDAYPYLLPCVVSSLFCTCATLALLPLKETVAKKPSSTSKTPPPPQQQQQQQQPEQELAAPPATDAADREAYPAAPEPTSEQPEASLVAAGSGSSSSDGGAAAVRGMRRPLCRGCWRGLRRRCATQAAALSSLRDARVRACILSQALLHFVVIGMAELFPLYASSPSGLGLREREVGLALSPLAISLFVWPLVYVQLERRFGTRAMLRLGWCCFLAVNATLPSLRYLRDGGGSDGPELSANDTNASVVGGRPIIDGGDGDGDDDDDGPRRHHHALLLWPLLVAVGLTRGVGGNSSFPSVSLLLNSLLTTNLGAMNGFSMSVASLSRACSPLFCGSLFSAVSSHGESPLEALPFYLLCVICLGGLGLTTRLPRAASRKKSAGGAPPGAGDVWR